MQGLVLGFGVLTHTCYLLHMVLYKIDVELGLMGLGISFRGSVLDFRILKSGVWFKGFNVSLVVR